MAAKRAVDHCMFCAPEPCTCNEKPKAKGKRLPSVPTVNAATVELPVDDVTPASAVSRLDRMRARAAEDAARMPAPVVGAELSPQPRRRATRPDTEPEKIDTTKMAARLVASMDEDTAALNGAVRALALLLSDADRVTYAEVLATQPSLDEQKLLWKARHRGYQANSASAP